MRFPRILSSVVFATIVILTAFASGHNYSLDVDCTPQGTHLNDTTTGGEICSGSASGRGQPAEMEMVRRTRAVLRGRDRCCPRPLCWCPSDKQ